MQDIALENILRLLEDDEEGIDAAITRELRIMNRQIVALAYYVLGDNPHASEHGEVLVKLAIEYLFGDWRDAYMQQSAVADEHAPDGQRIVTWKLGRAECRRELVWMEQFRDGMLWAVCLGNENGIESLANYPGDDVRGEAVSSDDFGLPEKAYYTLLARRLRGEGNSKAWKAEATIINRSRKKKPKLLLASLDRIVQADEEGFRGALIECLRYHVKRQFPKRGLANKLDLDASILYHAALRAGLRVDALASYRDYLVILKEGE